MPDGGTPDVGSPDEATPPPADVRRVGIVGTGEMGRPVVDRLVAGGHEVAAYARRPEVRRELAAAGVEVVDGVPALGRGCDVVIVYVYSDEQVRQVVLDDGLLGAMAPGSLLVVHTTGSPATMVALAEAAEPVGVAVVDAAGSGGPASVAASQLVLFAGGEEADVDRCRPLFAAYAAEVVHFGPVGAGQRVKLINNLLFGAHTELAMEAARLATAFDVDPVKLAATLRGCSGGSAALDLVSMMGSPEALLEGAGWTIYKDVHYALDLMRQLGTPLGSFAGVVDAALERTAPYRRD
jgi:3-hydroxyisobutyrate dehydrogenase-like beta-hydroxyacid dehydrogenase